MILNLDKNEKSQKFGSGLTTVLGSVFAIKPFGGHSDPSLLRCLSLQLTKLKNEVLNFSKSLQW